jgi:hypothetical protein
VKLADKRAIVASLSAYGHDLYKVLKWAGESSAGEDCDREAASLDEADIITSHVHGPRDLHTVMLDLDVPAHLVPSSTPGHSHLYIDAPMPWRTYKRLLVALADAGVIEHGYANVSVARRFTALRLPWIKKEEVVSGTEDR